MREKTNNFGFRPGLPQTGLYSHRSRLEARNFGFKKKKDCSVRVVKTKALISFAVTAQLIRGFVLAYANCWFSHAVAHLSLFNQLILSASLLSLSTLLLVDSSWMVA